MASVALGVVFGGMEVVVVAFARERDVLSSSGVLLFRHAAMVDGAEEGTMSLAAAELLVESAIDECERFYPVFQFVLWGGKTPKEAIAAALIDTQGEA